MTNDPLMVTTGVVRGSFVNVFRPRLNDANGREEYSMTMLVPKSDSKTLEGLKAAMKAAISTKWGDKAPPGIHSPIHDGDGPKENGEPYGEECHGHWVVSVKANSDYPPTILDQRRNKVLDADRFVSGDYCIVACKAYGYDKAGRKGVGFGLRALQIHHKGEPLGGGALDIESMFDVIQDQPAAASDGMW